MASELAMTTAALAGVALLGASVGVGMTFFGPLEPAPGDEPALEQDFVTRVFFESTETVHRTEEHEFPMGGTVEFAPLPVELLNVTYVVVTMHARLDGVALNDEFDLVVVLPDDRSSSGTYTGPLVNVNGYDINPRMIDWKVALSPTDITYETTDVEEALKWSAENHTRSVTQGDWRAVLDVGTPGLPGRTGTISLTYTFTHYEAVAALVDTSRPEADCGEMDGEPDDAATDDDRRERDDEDPAVTRCPEDGSGQDPQEEEGDPMAERRVAPRTFITQTPVARAVDRDPGPDGPL